MVITMNVGSKTAVGSWLAIVTIGVSLLSFGLSDDPNNGLRDANVELELLREGPNQTFLDVCRTFETRRDQGMIITPDQESRSVWAGKLLAGDQSSSWLSPGFEVKGLLWCPYPSKNMTVREALAVVNNPKSTSLTLWPHSSFLRSLGAAIRERQNSRDVTDGQENHDEFVKFYGLAADVAGGQRIAQIHVTSDPAIGTHTLFECSDTEAVFDPTDTNKAPKFPVQLIISLTGGSVYCFQENDVPPTVERIFGAGGVQMSGFYTSYFGGRIEKSTNYSNKAASKSGIRDVPKERQVPDAQGVIPLTEWFGFDFPALRSQIKDIGTLTVEDAATILNSKVESSQVELKLFNITLPIRLFMLSILIGLPLLTAVFLSGYRIHGALALPETIQGLPNLLITVALVCTVCLIPAIGLLLSANRLQFVLPNIAPYFPIAAACWGGGSVIALVSVHRSRLRVS